EGHRRKRPRHPPVHAVRRRTARATAGLHRGRAARAWPAPVRRVLRRVARCRYRRRAGPVRGRHAHRPRSGRTGDARAVHRRLGAGRPRTQGLVDHTDHVRLLRDGVTRGGTWADLGAGAGAFTLALAELVGPGGEVIAVDRDGGALRELERAVRRDGATVRTLSADFTKPLDLETLDGVVMANSLHFV